MVDQKLDALLVGALYGELAPADEARLTAHLESHPTDRSALDDLRWTRQTLRDSRFFEHVDPPASISALLLQEAARRAPAVAAEPSDGWFARLARAFAARPALAAAMTLVVIVGVAGAMFLKSASPDAAMPSYRAPAPAAAATTPSAMAAVPAAPAPARAELAVGGFAGKAALADDAKRSVVVDLASKDQSEQLRHAVATAQSAPPRVANKSADVLVDEEVPQPKELGKNDDRSERPGAVAAQASQAQPKPTPSTEAADLPAHAAPAKAKATENGWARDQHARVTTLVRDGHCRDAAPLAAEIETRAPSYYVANVANDRALAPCRAYIDGAVEQQQARAKAAAKAAPADAR